jgi:hypothetical protein
MNKARVGLFSALCAAGGFASCTADVSPNNPDTEFGVAEIALTNAPDDVHCVRLSVHHGSDTLENLFPLTPGEKAVFRLEDLPLGLVRFEGDAFEAACSAIAGQTPSWIAQSVSARLRPGIVKNIALVMVSTQTPAGGRAAVSVDFDEDGAPRCKGTKSSNPQAYMVPVAAGVTTQPILTAGDSPNLKPDGTPYRLVGIPDGAGAFDNGDGTFTYLLNHELGNNDGIVRAHGARGSFVSKHVICKDSLEVVSSQDLIQQHVLWVPGTGYAAPSTGTAFGRFCSADLADVSAYYDAESDTGFDGQLFMNGEETGAEGRAFAHGLDGTTWELPRLGKLSWENSVASPKPGLTTVVAGMDDSGGGQVYFYYGTKTNTGSAVDRAGLTNGKLYGLRVQGIVSEPAAGLAAPTPFDLYDLGNVENTTGAALETASNANSVTGFQRPEDGVWDPNNPNDYYWVTTAGISGTPPVSATRLWVLRFVDVHRPELGGEIEMLIDGLTEGGLMFDNMTIDRYGHVYLQEDVGGHVHIGRVLRYDIESDTLTTVVEAYRPYFQQGPDAARFKTIDEEGSGIIDASHILGAGWLISVIQSHNAVPGGEVVQDGQIFAIYDPAAADL